MVDESGFPLKVPHGFSLVGRRAGGAYDRSILSIIMTSISGIFLTAVRASWQGQPNEFTDSYNFSDGLRGRNPS